MGLLASRAPTTQSGASAGEVPTEEGSGHADASAKIVIDGVERVFATEQQEIAALGPLDVGVQDGEFVCLVGPSGCGKSTLLRILAGLVRPSKGQVSMRVASASGVAMVFQDYSIFPWKTVEANVRLGLDLAGVPSARAHDQAMGWLERLGLADVADHYPDRLSGGMRQRVSIARALAVEPEILLMDEPFAALDAQLRMVLQDELLRLWEADQRTVFFVTHSLEEAIMLGDRVLVMSARPGRLIAEYAVPFGRPRDPDLRGDAAFAQLHQEIWERLREQVDTALRAGEVSQ